MNPTGWSSCSDSPMSTAHHCLRQQGRRAFRLKWRTRSRSGFARRTDPHARSRGGLFERRTPGDVAAGLGAVARQAHSALLRWSRRPLTHPLERSPRAVEDRVPERGVRHDRNHQQDPVTKVNTMPATSGIHHVTRPSREAAPGKVCGSEPADRHHQRGGHTPRSTGRRIGECASTPSRPAGWSHRPVVDHAGDAGHDVDETVDQQRDRRDTVGEATAGVGTAAGPARPGHKRRGLRPARLRAGRRDPVRSRAATSDRAA